MSSRCGVGTKGVLAYLFNSPDKDQVAEPLSAHAAKIRRGAAPMGIAKLIENTPIAMLSEL